MDSDGRIDEVAAQRPLPRQRAIFVSTGKPAKADHVGRHNSRKFPGLGLLLGPRLRGDERMEVYASGNRAAKRSASVTSSGVLTLKNGSTGAAGQSAAASG
jgi:hypothetical protein